MSLYPNTNQDIAHTLAIRVIEALKSIRASKSLRTGPGIPDWTRKLAVADLASANTLLIELVAHYTYLTDDEVNYELAAIATPDMDPALYAEAIRDLIRCNLNADHADTFS